MTDLDTATTKVRKYRAHDGSFDRVMILDDFLAEKISRFNGYLSAEEVRKSIENGLTIYTEFSFWKKG